MTPPTNDELVLRQHDGTGVVWPVPLGVLTIGADPQCAVVRADASAAPLHAELVLQAGDGFVMRDRTGEHRTVIKGNAISSARIDIGAFIMLGHVERSLRPTNTESGRHCRDGQCHVGLARRPRPTISNVDPHRAREPRLPFDELIFAFEALYPVSIVRRLACHRSHPFAPTGFEKHGRADVRRWRSISTNIASVTSTWALGAASLRRPWVSTL